MDLLQIFLGKYFIELLGASIRFFLANLKNKLLRRDFIRFSKFWNNKGNQFEKMENETNNRIAGGFFLIIVLIIVVKFTT